jgi:hypothetical protein
MQNVKTVGGYLWAALGLPLILVTFMGMGNWAQLLVDVTGMRVTPWTTGGEVVRTVPHGAYRTEIYETVFQALIGERSEGFVQVAWTPKAAVPAVIDEEIDYDADGQNDFRLVWNVQSGEATLTPYAEAVLGLQGKYELDAGWAVRVNLKNKR